MTAEFDLVIRGGTVIDGSGGAPFEADVAVSGDRIVAVGHFSGSGREEIGAKGIAVMPGFVDIHTHYDGQVTWEDRLTPSSAHGVTTVVTGNCGVGFAPCRVEDHDRLIRLMEGVEDIPGIVLTEGVPWTWETFPEYLDSVEARPHDADIAAQLPHSALRVYVMGQRGADREQATEADLERMAELAREAMLAGAIGFGTSRTVNQRTSDGDPVFSRDAAESELRAIALALKSVGRGVLQVVPNFKGSISEEMAMYRRLVEVSGRPMSISVAQRHQTGTEEWRQVMELIEEANAAGVPLRAQVIGRPTGGFLGFELTTHPFSTHPSYQPIANLPLAEKVRVLRQPEFRKRLLSETPADPTDPMTAYKGQFAHMYPLGDPPNYEPAPETSVVALARQRGISPEEVAYDLLLERDGHAMLYIPMSNYAYGNLGPALAMMKDRNSVLGLGDGGAHCGFICDASYPTFMLTYWVRDRAGDRLSLPWVVKALSRDTAAAVGLEDRGIVAPGYKADLNIIDTDRLHLAAPEVVYDLPAGGRRLTQRADGYEATIVNGMVSYRDGAPTGKLPGRLVRGAQAGSLP